MSNTMDNDVAITAFFEDDIWDMMDNQHDIDGRPMLGGPVVMVAPTEVGPPTNAGLLMSKGHQGRHTVRRSKRTRILEDINWDNLDVKLSQLFVSFMSQERTDLTQRPET